MSKVVVNDTSLSAIGNAIRMKNGSIDKYKPSEMAEAIASIRVGEELPEEMFIATGDCAYKYAGWEWVIQRYGDRITTNNIQEASNMFYDCSMITDIPFEINAQLGAEQSMASMFQNASKLETIPKLNHFKPTSLQNIFNYDYRLKEIPEDIASWFDWSYIDGRTSSSGGSHSYMFNCCYSLRTIPMDFLSHANSYASNSSSYFNTGFSNCYSLDELVGLPVPYINSTWTSNAFNSSFTKCYRLKNIIFETPNGAPIVVKWKGQTIDLSLNVGYANSSSASFYNSGITDFTLVNNAQSYQALKNNPNWWTYLPDYSRYNHDSAVATINSLPDASAYLATAGGTNTIKFKKLAGRYTDGGAIQNLTAEEIAVASAKGWTVALV